MDEELAVAKRNLFKDYCHENAMICVRSLIRRGIEHSEASIRKFLEKHPDFECHKEYKQYYWVKIRSKCLTFRCIFNTGHYPNFPRLSFFDNEGAVYSNIYHVVDFYKDRFLYDNPNLKFKGKTKDSIVGWMKTNKSFIKEYEREWHLMRAFLTYEEIQNLKEREKNLLKSIYRAPTIHNESVQIDW